MKRCLLEPCAVFAVVMCALFTLGVGVRRHVVAAQTVGRSRPLPFTLESALHFRRVEMLYNGRSLPSVDTAVQYPEGVVTWASDTIGAEYGLAGLSHLFPPHVPLEERVRWISVLWFCLGIPLMAIWVQRRTGSRAGGWVAALYYAVGLGAVIRSTGQEIMRENFALPFLLAHLAADAEAAVAVHARRRHWAVAGSAVALTAALLCWDLIQFYLMMWTLIRLAVWFRRPVPLGDPVLLRWWVPLGVALLAAQAHPYYRAHGLLLSPTAVATGAMVLTLVAARLCGGPAATPPRTTVGLAVLAALALVLGQGGYHESYGHFGELLIAKIRFLNRKPDDPARLTFAQRMLWTPALHSATWRTIIRLFPFSWGLTLLVCGMYIVERLKKRSLPVASGNTFFYLVASFTLFVLFVRFHVYWAIFVAGVLGWSLALAERWSGRARGAWALVLAVALAGETAFTIRGARWWGRWDAPYERLEELAEWLKIYAAPAPVLANFGVSAFVLARGECPILLHPKFETRAIRDRVEKYGRELFTGTEESFRDWAESHGARYYVHAMGEFSPWMPEYQMRYMVNALYPPPTAPARLFEFRPRVLRKFVWEWGNSKYRVFRIVTRADEADAAGYAARAESALQEGRLDDAEVLAVHAGRLYPGEERALRVLRHVVALREAGFGRSEQEGGP